MEEEDQFFLYLFPHGKHYTTIGFPLLEVNNWTF